MYYYIMTVVSLLLLNACGGAYAPSEQDANACIIIDPSSSGSDLPCGPYVLCTKEYPMCIEGKCSVDICGDGGSK